MGPVVIYVNIICWDVINSAVIQGGSENTVEVSLPPPVAEALRVALARAAGDT